MTKQIGSRGPSHLGTAGRRLWREVTRGYDLEAHQLVVLQMAAEAYDRAEQARELVAKEGLTVTDRNGRVLAHPAVAIERDAAIRLLRALRELGLDAAVSEAYVRPARLQGGKRYA